MPYRTSADSFVMYLEGMITELRQELAPYKDGSAHAGRRANGEWVDITQARMEQIEREITALEHAVARHKVANA